MSSQKKVLSVESIRGWACFIVILSHFSLTFYPFLHAFTGKADPEKNPFQFFIHESPFGFFYSGTSAVFIFFVLSGFILTKVALKEGGVTERILSMSIKRYPRLMIPALSSCLIAYAGFYYFDVTSLFLSDWINSYGNDQAYSLGDAIYNGTVDVFFLSGESSYNPVLWTMKVELVGSFVVYMLCLNRITIRIPCLVFVFLLLTIMGLVFEFISDALGLGLVSFCGGYLFSIYGKKIQLKTALMIGLVGLYLAGVHNESVSYAFLYAFLGGDTYALCNFFSGFLIVYVILFNINLSNIFSGKLSVFMGKVSFSVYLIHMPILSIFSVSLFNYFLEFTGLYNIAAILSSVISIVFIYACALLFYKGIDSKGMIISNSIAVFAVAQFKAFDKVIRRYI